MIDREDVERINKKHGTLGAWFLFGMCGMGLAYVGSFAGGMTGAAIGAFVGVVMAVWVLK